MISNSGNLFEINGANLVVAGSLDYETAPSDPISVRVTDSGGATYDQSFTIQVKDLPGVTIAGGSGDDVINSTSTVAGQPLPTNEEDNISGGDGDDSISGLDGNDTLSGAAGADSLSGGVADDKLSGGWGNDTLSGDAGNDTLVGGAGADRLIGGAGADTFVFSAAADMASGSLVDTIADFTHAQGDRIDLSNVDANTLPSGNQNFTFIGTQSFHGVAGELHYAVTASGVTVSGDVDGNGAADFSIDVAGVTILAGGDFIL
jgi:Ca2+-binding RTX toxin-like protein